MFFTCYTYNIEYTFKYYNIPIRIAYQVSRKEKEPEKKENRKIKVINIFSSFLLFH